jgi:hypothetical protein
MTAAIVAECCSTSACQAPWSLCDAAPIIRPRWGRFAAVYSLVRGVDLDSHNLRCHTRTGIRVVWRRLRSQSHAS